MARRLAAMMLVCAAVVGVSLPAAGWERSSPNVPPDSEHYRDLDKLIAAGLIVPPIRGQRPWPRSEFARMTAEGRAAFKQREEEGADSFEGFVEGRTRRRQVDVSLARLEEEFHDELVDMGAVAGEPERSRIHPLKEFILLGTYLRSPPTTIPVNNGRGSINAQVNPLRDYNLGRNATDGTQLALEWTSWLEAGRFFSASVRPRFEVDAFRTADMGALATVQNAYGTFRAGNFSLEVGRDTMLWGMGERGALLFSTNPRPLDGIWITNPTPERLPWVFKHLGRWRYTLFAVTHGPNYSQPWAFVAGYKASLAPAKYVELGFSHAVTIGGRGMPAPSAIDVIGEFFGFRPGGTDPGSPNISDHIFEIDALVRIPQLRGFEIYGNMALDDKWKSIKKTLRHGASYLGGFYLPALNPSGTLDLRLEYVHTNPLMYRHSLFSDGFTQNGRFLGTDAGPDAEAVHLQLRQTVSKNMWAGIALGWDYRRSDSYTELQNADGTTGDIVKTATGPAEQRWRGMADLAWRAKPDLRLSLAAGYERVKNSQYVAGRGRSNFLIAAALAWDFDRHFGFAAR